LRSSLNRAWPGGDSSWDFSILALKLVEIGLSLRLLIWISSFGSQGSGIIDRIIGSSKRSIHGGLASKLWLAGFDCVLLVSFEEMSKIRLILGVRLNSDADAVEKSNKLFFWDNLTFEAREKVVVGLKDIKEGADDFELRFRPIQHFWVVFGAQILS
jgi:hypothetical protein